MSVSGRLDRSLMKKSGSSEAQRDKPSLWVFHSVVSSRCKAGEWQRHGAFCSFCGMAPSCSQ